MPSNNKSKSKGSKKNSYSKGGRGERQQERFSLNSDSSRSSSTSGDPLSDSERREQARARRVIPALANRSFHIPGNGYLRDWLQYFTNNHPILGICCHDRLHPIKFNQRIVVLVGSIASGLVITNCVYLWFLFESEEGLESEFIEIAANVSVIDSSNEVKTVSVTNYQVFLWTFGAALHSTFDLTVWYLTACACCLPGGVLECCGGLRWLASYLVIFIIVIVAAAASLSVVLRATVDSLEDEAVYENITTGGLLDDQLQFGDIDGVESFRFLVTFCVELTLSLFVYNPVLGTLLFSGVLGCGTLPLLGGRPRDVFLEERALERKRRREARRAGGIS